MSKRESFNGSKMLREGMAKSSFVDAYVEAIFFTEANSDSEPGMQDASVEDVSFDLASKILHDCAIFETALDIIRELDETDNPGETQAGHDFWLTRNGHGAGFWDGDWSEPLGEQLTKLAHSFGEVNVYRGDDGLLYA